MKENIKHRATDTMRKRHSTISKKLLSSIALHWIKVNLAESGESAESNEVDDGDDEELPTKSELEWMILKYIQPIHRY